MDSQGMEIVTMVLLTLVLSIVFIGESRRFFILLHLVISLAFVLILFVCVGHVFCGDFSFRHPVFVQMLQAAGRVILIHSGGII